MLYKHLPFRSEQKVATVSQGNDVLIHMRLPNIVKLFSAKELILNSASDGLKGSFTKKTPPVFFIPLMLTSLKLDWHDGFVETSILFNKDDSL